MFYNGFSGFIELFDDIYLDFKYRIGMDIYGSWRKFCISFLVCNIRGIIVEKVKWKFFLLVGFMVSLNRRIIKIFRVLD